MRHPNIVLRLGLLLMSLPLQIQGAERAFSDGVLNPEADGYVPDLSETSTAPARDEVVEALSTLPGVFVENHGQADEDIAYYSRLPGFSVDLAPYEISASSEGRRQSIRFESAQDGVQIQGIKQHNATDIVLLDTTSQQVHSTTPGFDTVLYRDLYPSIDLELRAASKVINYAFVLQPSAKPEAIELAPEEIDTIQSIDAGNLLMLTDDGNKLMSSAPNAYQVITGTRIPVECAYTWDDSHHLSFVLGGYNPSFPLRIEAEIDYGTYLGGSGNDFVQAIAVDSLGNVYIAGQTDSTDFPITAGAYSSTKNSQDDLIVAVLDPTLSSLVYSTYIGGYMSEACGDIAVDDNGNIYLTGWTYSPDFPSTAGAYDTTKAGGIGESDAFIIAFDPTLSTLLYGTFLGKQDNEVGNALSLDNAGNVYVVGMSNSSDFATTAGAYDTTPNGDYDTFVAALDPTLHTLIHSTVIGGSLADQGRDLVLDASNNVYVTGITASSEYPTSAGAYDSGFSGGRDIFISVLDPTLGTLVYSTYLGGSGNDVANSISRNDTGTIYIAGNTDSSDYPVSLDAYDDTYNGGIRDAVSTALSPNLGTLVYSTYLGGSDSDTASRIVQDADGSVHMTGTTLSDDFPVTPDGIDTSYNGEGDAFVVSLNPALDVLAYGSYLGAGLQDGGSALALGDNRTLVLGGFTRPDGFPVSAGAFDTTYNGNRDGFVTIFNLADSTCSNPLSGVTLSGPVYGWTDTTLQYDAVPEPGGVTQPITYTWSVDGLVSGQGTSQATYSWPIAGSKSVHITAINCGGQVFNDNQSVDIVPQVAGAPLLDPISNADGDSSFTVSWGSVTNATTYTLEMAGNSSFSDATAVYIGPNTSTSITGASPGTLYFRVQASNIGGESTWSITQSVVVYSVPNTPTLEPILNADGDGDYDVTWSNVTDATAYTLQVADNSGFTGATAVYVGSDSSLTVTGASPGIYYYRVQAANVRGSSTWSNVESAVVVALPTAPILGDIDNSDGDGNYTVSWDSITDAMSYSLEEDTSSNFAAATVVYTGPNVSYQITGRSPDVYYYRVIASNVRGNSAWSNIQSAVVNDLPAAPTLYAINNTDGDGDYVVTWEDTESADAYTLQQASDTVFSDAQVVYDGSNTSFAVRNRLPGRYYYRVRATVDSIDSPWSTTQSVFVQSVDGDSYEPDDICTQAAPVSTSGGVQAHTFHIAGDVDWAAFDATTGRTYIIEIQVPPDSGADVELELHSQCAGLPLESQNYSFAPGARIEFEAPSAGPFYLKVQNADPTVAGSDVAYRLSVRALGDTAQPGALVLVAGRLRMYDPLQDNIYYVTDQVRELFLSQGYDDNRIFYLAPDTSHPNVDALASATNLEQALTTWAISQVETDRPLTLYMMDHGSSNVIYLDEPRGESVSPTQIDTWLDAFESQVPEAEVNVIIEACHSGSFIQEAQSISGSERVVIASTSADQYAWASDNGAIFSDHLLTALGRGESLYSSFETARWAAAAANTLQDAWLDDNGNAVANEDDDGAVAAQRGFSFVGTLADEAWPPYIVQALGPDTITNSRGEIRAQVTDDHGVKRVWAVVYPPDYAPPTATDTLVSDVLPTFVLLDQGQGWYAATYTGFNMTGSYRVVIYAEDEAGIEARPYAVHVQTGWRVFLPLVIR